jgi:hypothetical protein
MQQRSEIDDVDDKHLITWQLPEKNRSYLGVPAGILFCLCAVGSTPSTTVIGLFPCRSIKIAVGTTLRIGDGLFWDNSVYWSRDQGPRREPTAIQCAPFSGGVMRPH